MPAQYSLDAKIHALNLIDRHDGNILLVRDILGYSAPTLRRWLKNEADLRERYRSRQRRRRVRLLEDLQVELLERSREVLAKIDATSLEDAPLNQLASALNSSINYALKLEEIVEQDAEEIEEPVVRFEYVYDGEARAAPPWADDRAQFEDPV